jgi:hypothetical protein
MFVQCGIKREEKFLRSYIYLLFPSEYPANDAECEWAVLTGISSRIYCKEGARRVFLAWDTRTAADKVGWSSFPLSY